MKKIDFRPVGWCQECAEPLRHLYAGAYKLCETCGKKREEETNERF